MARIEWVHQRLQNWALWKARGEGGGVGYATQAIFADGPAARGEGWYGDNRIPHDEIEAAITDDAVESLRLGFGHLHKTLQLIYLRDLGVKGAAHAMGRAESTIHAQLAQADRLIVTWLEERKARINQKGLALGAASLSVRAAVDQARTSPALEAHDALRAKAARKRQEERAASKGRKTGRSVQPPAAVAAVQPPVPRDRRRPVLRLRKSFTT